LKRLRLIITGNPGVGKHTSARIVAKKLKAEIVDINKVALNNAAIAQETDHGLDVDLKKLRRLIAKLLLSNKDLVIVGHLAPYAVRPAGITMVSVLRRSPYALQKTLEGRGYSHSKVLENTSSEILGVSMYDAIKAFGKPRVAEFDTTRKTPEATASEIIATLKEKLPKKTGIVDWLTLVSEKDDVRHFFEY
jgi:adenylate kinase